MSSLFSRIIQTVSGDFEPQRHPIDHRVDPRPAREDRASLPAKGHIDRMENKRRSKEYLIKTLVFQNFTYPTLKSESQT